MSSKPTAKALPGKPIEANTVSSMELNYTRDSIAMTGIRLESRSDSRIQGIHY